MPKIRVQNKGTLKTFTPEEISSMVLTKMKETAEAYLVRTESHGCSHYCACIFQRLSETGHQRCWNDRWAER